MPGNIKTSLVTGFFSFPGPCRAGHENSADGRVGLNLLHQFSCEVYFTEQSSDSEQSAGKNAEEILCAFRSATSVPSLKDSRTFFWVN